MIGKLFHQGTIMDRNKIKHLAWKDCLIDDGQEVTQEILSFAAAIEKEILGRSHFVRLPSGGFIRGDEITAIRKLDVEKFGQLELLPLIVVDFGSNCIVIDCESDSIRNNMADVIMRDIDLAIAAINGRVSQEFLNAAIADAKYFEQQRDMLIAALVKACAGLDDFGYERGIDVIIDDMNAAICKVRGDAT